MNPLLLAALLLQPVVTDAEGLRLVHDADEPVAWIIDGQTHGSTEAHEPLLVALGPGPHDVWAIGPDNDWHALARIQPEPNGTMQNVPAWMERHVALPPPKASSLELQSALGMVALVGLGFVAWRAGRSGEGRP